MERNILRDAGVVEDVPEAVGISSRHIAAYLQRLRECDYEIHSLQIIRKKKLIFAAAADPYTLESPHRLLSAAKAIIAAAVLFAIDEGRLSFDSRIIDFFQDKLPENYDRRFERITVYDLLTMQSGQNSDRAFMNFIENTDTDLCRSFFSTPMDCEPGTCFFYNNSIPHLLFFLVERATGEEIASFIQKRIADPLGIEITAQYDENHMYDPVTTVLTANGLLKFGLWILQKGKWNGKQLLDRALLEAACSQQTWTGNVEPGYGNGKGYCMQMWKNAFGGCRMDGGGGQIALTLPEYEMTAVLMGNEARADMAIRMFYEDILSRLREKPLPADEEGKRLLKAAVRDMSRAPYHASAHSRTEEDINGKTFFFVQNRWRIQSIRARFAEEEAGMVILQDGRVCQYKVGLNAAWRESGIPFILPPDTSIQNRIYGPDPERCLLSGGWTTEREFEIVCKSLASMGEYRFHFCIEKGRLKLRIPEGISAGMKEEKGFACLESI